MKKLIKLKDINVQINSKPILDQNNVNIEINEGDKIAIIGKNGSGKSTLINVILNEISYEGLNESNISTKDIGVLFQVNEYIDMIKVSEIIQLVNNCSIKSQEYKKFIEKYELSSIENKFVKSLSGGERQKLTVSLVINQNKELYIFDELTTGLDYEKRKKLMSLVKSETKNRTVINITHYFEEVESWVNKVLIIHNGKILFYEDIETLHDISNYYSSIEIVSDYSPSVIPSELGIIFDDNKVITLTKEQNDNLKTFLDERNIKYFEKGKHLYATYYRLVVDK